MLGLALQDGKNSLGPSQILEAKAVLNLATGQGALATHLDNSCLMGMAIDSSGHFLASAATRQQFQHLRVISSTLRAIGNSIGSKIWCGR